MSLFNALYERVIRGERANRRPVRLLIPDQIPEHRGQVIIQIIERSHELLKLVLELQTVPRSDHRWDDFLAKLEDVAAGQLSTQECEMLRQYPISVLWSYAQVRDSEFIVNQPTNTKEIDYFDRFIAKKTPEQRETYTLTKQRDGKIPQNGKSFTHGIHGFKDAELFNTKEQ